jgi:hypothetical protein
VAPRKSVDGLRKTVERIAETVYRIGKSVEQTRKTVDRLGKTVGGPPGGVLPGAGGGRGGPATHKGMLQRIETQSGKAERTWLMDRGIPTEAVLEQMRTSTPPGRYLVGTPKGRLSKLEQDLAKLAWQPFRQAQGPEPAEGQARPGVEVKLLPQDGSTSSRRARIASPRSAACAGAGSKNSGRGSWSSRRKSSPTTSCS